MGRFCVAKAAALDQEIAERVVFDDDHALLVVRVDDEIFALVDNCSHQDYPLSEGYVEDCTIECVMHGSRFDLRTGMPKTLPATRPVETFPALVRGDDVVVELEDAWATAARAAGVKED